MNSAISSSLLDRQRPAIVGQALQKISADGERMYQTDPINGSVGVFDVSQVQDREPEPEVRELRRMTWKPISVPQNSRELVIDGDRYLLEFDPMSEVKEPSTATWDLTTPSVRCR